MFRRELKKLKLSFSLFTLTRTQPEVITVLLNSRCTQVPARTRPHIVAAHGRTEVAAHGRTEVAAHGRTEVPAHGRTEVPAHGRIEVTAYGAPRWQH